jgi:glycerate 2-kinase
MAPPVNTKEVYSHLTLIAEAGIRRADPYEMIMQGCSLDRDKLTVSCPGGARKSWDLSSFKEIVVLGAGKAASKMALALEKLLNERITGGIIAVKPGHTEKLSRIEQIEASHPVPDERSVSAAESILALARKGKEKTLFINLISGGGSSLLCLPAEGITLKDKQAVTKLLLGAGATIQEMNCIRKHLSGIKGGRLARALYPAVSINLVLSDVVGDRLDSIASGLLVPDRTTFKDALDIVAKYGLKDSMPPEALVTLEKGLQGEIEETPKPDEPAFTKSTPVLIGTNSASVTAALKKAEALGYTAFNLGSFITGEAREAAKFFLALGKGVQRGSVPVPVPACLIGGGETTVTLRGGGLGGRNQEFALSFTAELGAGSDRESCGNIYLLAAATDGNDGPTEAAGGFGSLEGYKAGEKLGLSIQEYLGRNDSYRYLKKTGFLYSPGPTNTNVCDLYIMVIK